MKYLKTYNQMFEFVNNDKDIQVESYEDLLDLLNEYNIDLEMYGTGIFKTVKHLWNELKEGECVLSDVNGKLNRNVDFIGAKVMYKRDGVNYRLWEDRAEFKDGRVRIRPIEHSMAEKFKRGENPKDVLVRGMKEELSIELRKNQFTFYNKERIEENGDYPGIDSYHNGLYYMILLYDDQFKPQYIEHQKDKTIYYVWREMKPKSAGHYPMPIGSDKVF